MNDKPALREKLARAIAKRDPVVMRALVDILLDRIEGQEQEINKLRAEIVRCSETLGLIAAPVPGDNQAIARHHAKRLNELTQSWRKTG